MGAMRENLWVELATNSEHRQHKQFVEDVKNSLFQVDYPEYHRLIDERTRRGARGPVVVPRVGAWDFTVDREAALRAYNEVKEVAKRQGYLHTKGIRPYVYDSFDHLDRSEVWWGFEFETGYGTKAERDQAIEFAWNVANDGVTFDGEGEGNYRSEITFSPAEQSKFVDGTAPATQFMRYIAANQLGQNNGGTYIGTHFNLSVPRVDSHSVISRVLNNSMHHLPTASVRQRLFGRSQIYAGCINHDQWIECKIFRTTYNAETWERYVRVCQAMSKIAVAARDFPNANESTTCTNLEAMVEDPSLAPVLQNVRGYYGSDSGAYVSSNSSNDRY